MDLITTILGGVFSGGATGLLGLLLQRWFDQRKAQTDLQLVQLQLASAERTRQIELQAQERMAAKAADVQALQATLDAQAREAEAAERSYAASLAADAPRFTTPAAQEGTGRSHAVVRVLMAIVDGVRGLMRPAMTTYSLVLLTMVFWWVRELYQRAGLAMTPEQIHQLAMQCVGTVFYLATTGYVWWFGVRPAQPPARK